MKKSIYNISEEYFNLVSEIEENGGEVNKEIETKLMMNREDMDVKAMQYGLAVKDIEQDIDIIDAEVKRLNSLKATKSKTIERLKEAVSGAMHMYGIKKISLPTLKISFLSRESVNITDELLIPDAFKDKKEVVTVSKKRIADAIKEGDSVPGAEIIVKDHIQFK